MAPAATYPILPLEIIDNICQKLVIRDLATVSRANSALNPIATRRLYHTIGTDLHPARLLRCMITLDRNMDLALLVKSFEVNLINNLPTKTYYVLLERILKKTTNLTALVIELPKRHSPAWVLPSPKPGQEPVTQIFRLHSFTTSMHCKTPLARFLDTQPEIAELTLRGINSEAFFPFITSLFHTVGALAPSFAKSARSSRSQFELLPTSLPKLAHFNAIHAGPNVIRNIITSRPVTHMSIPLFPPHTMDTLSALSLASKPLTRLSLMSFDPAAPSFLFKELASRFSELQALHLVVLMAEVSAGMLLDWGQFLVGFKKLRYITFMAALGDEDGREPKEEIDERKIAKIWHSACPTLKTIILPQGKVWFEGSDEKENMEGEGNWRCLNWDDD